MKNRNLRCIVSNCYESGQQDSRSMFKFPINPVIRQKWMENIGRLKDLNLFNSRVCRRHFEAQCFGKTKVFSWALPTLYLGEKEVLHQISKPRKKPLTRKCSVRNCPSQSPPERLHFFPTDPELRKKWMDICRLKMDNKWLFICGRHFRRSFLPNSYGNLRRDAVPELYLGLEGEDPLGKGLKSERLHSKRTKVCSKSDDSGIDEESCKESIPHESCSNCLNLKQQLSAALQRIEQLEERPHTNTDSDEEEEYIFMLMK
ncbi:uncharacterized protein LOC108042356 [Drosophila rhopaloa]|uniref:Uncharacterized protein LOC108042356 n=1 Tax=Drosophila rhopaloa TaxID=1041015 RepID=A0A6P4EM24_DRORH|nr:uncharacterized protein LOC108042356 [Drosophila rhopaloa]